MVLSIYSTNCHNLFGEHSLDQFRWAHKYRGGLWKCTPHIHTLFFPQQSEIYCVCLYTEPSSLCLSGPKVMRWERPTTITVIIGVASPWSRPHPLMPAEMPTLSLELLSNLSLSPLTLLDRVSTEHLNTHTHSQQCSYRGEQVRSRAWTSVISLQLSPLQLNDLVVRKGRWDCVTLNGLSQYGVCPVTFLEHFITITSIYLIKE